MADLHVFRIGPDWVVAVNEDDAVTLIMEQYGIEDDEVDAPIRLDDDAPLSISHDDAGPQHECPHGCATWAVMDLNHAVDSTGHHPTCPATHETKTNAEWAAQGRGFLCSTEW